MYISCFYISLKLSIQLDVLLIICIIMVNIILEDTAKNNVRYTLLLNIFKNNTIILKECHP